LCCAEYILFDLKMRRSANYGCPKQIFQATWALPEVVMNAFGSTHPGLSETLRWLEGRLIELEANGEVEASYALSAEHADWLLGCPQACSQPLTFKALGDGVAQG
jgi:hypothetical protein